MEKYIYDEKNSLWYELQGDYYLPCLKLPEEEQQPVGLWGQRHLRYIKQNRKVFYLNLLTSGKLNGYLSERCIRDRNISAVSLERRKRTVYHRT